MAKPSVSVNQILPSESFSESDVDVTPLVTRPSEAP